MKSIPDKLAVAGFQGAKDNVPKQFQLTWPELVARLSQHEEREVKDGYLWSPTLYRSGATRSNSGVVLLSCVVLDFDHGSTSWPTVRDWLGDLAFVAHSTFSHTEELPSFRVAIPLVQPVLAEHWADTWRRVSAAFPGCDQQAKDPCRIYYLPAHKPGAVFWSETNS